MNITLEEARKAFALWWKEYTENPTAFSGAPDLEGKDSATVFFEYVERIRK